MNQFINNLDNVIKYSYRFTFGNGTKKTFDINLDARTFDYLPNEELKPPEWANLTYNRCANCALDEKQYTFCPVALNITSLVAAFKDMVSYEEVNIAVTAGERSFSKQTTAQQGVSSLLGIYMVASRCPFLMKLKPLLYFHLPFATPSETIFRVASMYLLAQYFLKKNDQSFDLEMKGLVSLYEDIQKVNKGILSRIRDICKNDAVINAVIKLDLFARNTPDLVKEDLERIKYLFTAYFQPQMNPVRSVRE
ncbi:MAG: hypothetical protein AAB019_04880 [Planctomycetota bacterium]